MSIYPCPSDRLQQHASLSDLTSFHTSIIVVHLLHQCISQQVHLQIELNSVISYSLVSEIRAHNFQRFELKRTYVSNGYAKSRTPHHSITSPPSPKSTLLPIQKNNVLCIPTPSLITLSFFFSSQKQQMFRLYLNLAVQRPMTSPWHTSSALNSEPSSVR
jgi:hypothetical protein